MYQIKHQSKEDFLELDPKDFNWDLVQVEDQAFHILYQNRSYTARVIAADYQSKSFEIRIGQNTYCLSAKDRFDLLAERLGFEKVGAAKVNDIKAPMPGLLLHLMVEVGQEVKKDEAVLILEAMKMENVIKAPADAIIKAIKVDKGAAVEKNQVLIDLDPL